MDAFLDRLATSDEVLAVGLTFALSIVFAIGARLFRARPILLWSAPSEIFFRLRPDETNQNQTIPAFTRSITIENAGRQIATEIEVIFNSRPRHFETFPHLPFTDTTNADGRYVVTFSKPNPKEFIFIYLFSLTEPIPLITYVRCSGHSAKFIHTYPQRKFSNWVNTMIAIIMVLGIFAAIYIPVRLLL